MACQRPDGHGHGFEKWRSEAIDRVSGDCELSGKPDALESQVIHAADELASRVGVTKGSPARDCDTEPHSGSTRVRQMHNCDSIERSFLQGTNRSSDFSRRPWVG